MTQSDDDFSGDNLFTANMGGGKGEFGGGGGYTNPGGVSGIFKENAGGSVTRIVLLVLLIAGAGGGGYYFWSMTGDGDEDGFLVDDEFDDTMAEGDDEDDDLAPEMRDIDEDESANDVMKVSNAGSPFDEPIPADDFSPDYAPSATTTHSGAVREPYQPLPRATQPPQLASPENGAVRYFDDSSRFSTFSWSGSPGGQIAFSRSPDMKPVALSVRVRGNEYQFHRPSPGTWYWQVSSGAGKSEIRSFAIAPPIRRKIALEAPQDGGSVSANGGLVAWTGDRKVVRYRVELSRGSWANPDFRFATSGTQYPLNGVVPGEYQLRIGGYSEVSNRWEYTDPIRVVVQ